MGFFKKKDDTVETRAYTIETRLNPKKNSIIGGTIQENPVKHVSGDGKPAVPAVAPPKCAPPHNPDSMWNILFLMRDQYCQIYRTIWHEMTASDFKQRFPSRSKYITEIMHRYGILKRTANSLYNEIEGRMKAYMELKKTELVQLDQKTASLGRKIAKLEELRSKLKPDAAAQKLSDKDLKKYRCLKSEIYWKKNKLNKLKQKRSTLQSRIDSARYNVCFGSKEMFRKQYHLEENGFKSHRAWLRAFRERRDTCMFFLGSAEENHGNQLVQMTYHPDKEPGRGTFSVLIRKERKFCSEKKGVSLAPNCNSNKWMRIDGLTFNHLTDELIQILSSVNTLQGKDNDTKRQAVSYRLHFVGKKIYLQVLFSITYKKTEIATSSSSGALGCDFNNGFIEVAETDASGKLISKQHIELKYHGTGNAAKSEIEEVLHHLAQQARDKGKDLVREDLDFAKKKAEQLPGAGHQGKDYNRALHTLDYSRYISTMDNICHRLKVRVVQVNPAYTSKIAEQQFCEPLHLNRHEGAAYVIARRGQGITDTYKMPSTLESQEQQEKSTECSMLQEAIDKAVNM